MLAKLVNYCGCVHLIICNTAFYHLIVILPCQVLVITRRIASSDWADDKKSPSWNWKGPSSVWQPMPCHVRKC
jgi:hypothetical protein